VRVAKGWKAGGFNGESENLAVAKMPFNEETVTSVELGIKASIGDSVNINAAYFDNSIDDMQLSEFLGASGYSQISNAGSASIKGAEVELIAALSDALTLNLNYGTLDASYDSFVQYGMELKDFAKFPYAPEVTYSIGANYQLGDFNARIDYSFVDDHALYYDQASADATMVKAYSLLNASVTLANIALTDALSLKASVWGKNLTDEEYYINGIPLGPIALNYFGNPRTVGADVEFTF
jgi:iron complex outermembrane receptor protein